MQIERNGPNAFVHYVFCHRFIDRRNISQLCRAFTQSTFECECLSIIIYLVFFPPVSRVVVTKKVVIRENQLQLIPLKTFVVLAYFFKYDTLKKILCSYNRN